jgi:uncharacterized membrane protein
MLAGVGILSNSLLFLLIFIPFFIFVYYAIVLAEENFLSNKFGQIYIAYARRVNRWLFNFRGIGNTFKSMHFKWKRWVLKEYNTQYVWLSGITLIILLKYDEVTNFKTERRNYLLIIILSTLLLLYLLVRYLKKSGKMVE